MPPKKAEKDEDPDGYNLNAMSLGQLKGYARLLESEIEDMREHCNFYQKTEDEMVHMLKATEEELRSNEYAVIFNDAKLEKIRLELLGHFKERKECPAYVEYKSADHGEKLLSDTENTLQEEENRHVEETKRLQSQLVERDRESESLRVQIEMTRIDAQETTDNDLRRMDKEQKRLLESSLQRFDATIRETLSEFRKAKEMMECDAQEARIAGERNLNLSCEGFKKKLQAHYQEVTRQDLETIRKLKNAIKRVGANVEACKRSLLRAREQNARLKAETKTGPSAFAPPTKFNAGPLKISAALKVHNKMERLALENQSLEAQIKEKMDQICLLRQRFTIALKEVRQSAERKVSILQRKLDFILEDRERCGSSNATLESSSVEQSSVDLSVTDESLLEDDL